MSDIMSSATSDTLHIVWTSNDKDVAEKMVFMYATNSRLKGWWENVHLIIWGASAKLFATDTEIQDLVRVAIEAGVDVSACRRCAEMFGIDDFIEQFGDIELIYIGEQFTHILKGPDRVITF